MKSYFQSFEAFTKDGGSTKTSTIKPPQLLPAIVANMKKLNTQFTLYVNGRLPKSIDQLLEDAFEQSHMQHPFYTQHCEFRSYRYMNVSKSRVKIDFTIQYRMNRKHEKWMLDEIESILKAITRPTMTTLEKIVAVHDYVAKTFTYDLHTAGSPYAVYTFMQEKHGVCMAYALLFEKMMEMLEIPCYYVIGKADGESDAGHAWNMVELDGQWYHIDVTWNDIGSKSKKHEIRYRYFLCSDELMKKDHQWNLRQYPPCTSENFKGLHALYDVCIVGETLYYPHQKTAYLYQLRINDAQLQAEKCLNMRVQFIKHQEGQLYFSNYSQKGYLNCYDLQTKALTVLNDDEVTAIHLSEAGLEVHSRNGETKLIEKTIVEEEEVQVNRDLFDDVSDDEAVYESIPMIHFDTIWMATFEQQMTKPLRFTSEEQLTVIVEDHLPQITVEIVLGKQLEITLTSKRKNIQWLKAPIVIIPLQLLPAPFTTLFERSVTGEVVALHYEILNDCVYLRLLANKVIEYT